VLPEVCFKRPALEKSEGAGNAGRSMHPQPRVQNEKAHEHSHHGHTGTPGIPYAMVLTTYFGLSPVIGLSCHRRLSELLPLDLTPASRRQDHTTSSSALARFVKRALSVHRIPLPTSVTCARPSLGTGPVRSIPVSTSEESGIFFPEGLDGNLTDLPARQFTDR
jgi:hypothetical protein